MVDQKLLHCTRTKFLPLLNVFFPHFCRDCGVRILTEQHPFFCPTCWESSPRITPPFCTICGRPHPLGTGLMNPNSYPCGPCATNPNRFPFRRLMSAAYFTGAIADTIKLLKFRGKKRAAHPLIQLLTDMFQTRPLDIMYHFIIPVPLHKVRERERGFNQSLLLAQGISKLFPTAVLDTSLKRIRPTHPQSLLMTPKERKENVRGAFAVDKNAAHLKGANVLLVDDVVTTYGTVSECVIALLHAGVATVDVVCVALAIPSK